METKSITESAGQTENAGFSQRFGNWLIDYVLYLGGSCYLLNTLLPYNDETIGVLWWVLAFGYYMLFDGILQRTPGKLVTGTRVVTTEGSRPSYVRIFVRTLCRLLPFDPISFFFSKDGRCWHDIISGTRVIGRSSAAVDDTAFVSQFRSDTPADTNTPSP